MSWMKVGVFERIMSVLVNRSHTMDFKVGKLLRRGDKISPLLFSIAAEGLTRIVKNKIRARYSEGSKPMVVYHIIFYNLLSILY